MGGRLDAGGHLGVPGHSGRARSDGSQSRQAVHAATRLPAGRVPGPATPALAVPHAAGRSRCRAGRPP